MAEEKKRGGAKMSRSEIVTVRLDSRLRYMAELAARKQRRTLSSYIEWAIEHSLTQVKLYEGTGSGYGSDDPDVTVADQITRLWDVDDSERFVKLAIAYPELLTIEEQEMWKMLWDAGVLDAARSRDRFGAITWNHSLLEDRVYTRLRSMWPAVQEAHAAGPQARQKWIDDTRTKATTDAIKSIGAAVRAIAPAAAPAKPASGFEDMDDDIPF